MNINNEKQEIYIGIKKAGLNGKTKEEFIHKEAISFEEIEYSEVGTIFNPKKFEYLPGTGVITAKIISKNDENIDICFRTHFFRPNPKKRKLGKWEIMNKELKKIFI
ncbi:MAG: hypothetical protein KO202_07755 [Methanobacteriaceae archaeon]|jgi:hypothetical protein|nr:hypothetical protein [Methanobacteriaceae archaeon]